MSIKGIDNLTSGCVIIAMDMLFPNGYEGKEFVEDMFNECLSFKGFNIEELKILEECAPVKYISEGSFTSTYNQGDTYWQLRAWNQDKRYRLPYHRNVILMYTVDKEKRLGHAVCIPAANVNTYLEKYEWNGILMPTEGLIVDSHMEM